MIEIAMIVAGVVLMARVASFERRSAWGWGALTLGLCITALLLDWAFLRIVLAVVGAIAIMTVAKCLSKSP